MKTATTLLLLATANLSQAVRAEQVEPASATETDQTSTTVAADPVAQSVRQAMGGPMIVPIDLKATKDTALVRDLLLSHGIELDLGDRDTLDNAAFHHLLKTLKGARKGVTAISTSLESVPDIELQPATQIDLDAAQDMRVLLAPLPAASSEAIASTSGERWQTTWLKTTEKPSPTGLNNALVSTRQRQLAARPGSEHFLIQVENERPATAQEQALLKPVADAPVENTNTPDLRAAQPTTTPAQLVVEHSIYEKNLDLLGWLGKQGIEVNAARGCTLNEEQVSELKELLRRDPDIIDALSLDLSVDSDDHIHGVSREWLVFWLQCKIDVLETIEPASTAPAQVVDIPLEVVPDVTVTPLPVPVPAETVVATPQPLDTAPPDQQSAGIFAIDDEVPEGFASLGGPVTQFVDVFFNQKKVGDTTITVVVDEFTFDDPQGVITMLGDIKNKDTVESNFYAPLSTNADKLCFAPNDPEGCGTLFGDPLAALYDENQLRLDVFLGAEYQNVVPLGAVRYLPPPERRTTSILSLYGVASDFANEDSALDLSARGLLGYGAGNIEADVDFNTRTDQERLSELKLTHYFGNYEVTAGTYGFDLNGGLTNLNVLGAGFSTTFKTRVDLENAFSSELNVFLPRRAIVQLAVDDRIYSAQSYAAGNQAIDTRALPEGSYELEIRIVEANGQIRTETRVFTKSAQIPPRGEYVIDATAGLPVSTEQDSRFLPHVEEQPVAGFGLSRRINDRSAYRLGMLQIDERSIAQANFIYIGSRLSWQLSSSLGEDNIAASSLQAGFVKDKLSANLSARIFRSDVAPGNDPTLLSVFPANNRQASLAITRTFDRFGLSARASYREVDEDTGTERAPQYSLTYRQPVFRRKDLRALFTARFLADDTEDRVDLKFSVFARHHPWTSVLEAGFNRNVEEVDATIADMNETTRTTDGHVLGADVNWRGSNEGVVRYEAGGYATSRESSTDFGVRASAEHSLFRASAATDWNVEGDNTNRNSVATLSAHLGVDRRGAAIGGSDFAKAGVIIDVRGEPRGERFDIVVNTIKVSTGTIGQAQFIALQPFEVYSLKLVPKSVLSNGLGEDVHEFTLYPGTVQRIDVQTRRQVLLIGTLVNGKGEIIQNALIDTEANPLLIDESGLFQAEVSPGSLQRVRLQDDSYCEFVVPEPAEGEEVLVPADPITCLPQADIDLAGNGS